MIEDANDWTPADRDAVSSLSAYLMKVNVPSVIYDEVMFRSYTSLASLMLSNITLENKSVVGHPIKELDDCDVSKDDFKLIANGLLELSDEQATYAMACEGMERAQYVRVSLAFMTAASLIKRAYLW
jgi:hypothetical protein